MSVMVVLLAASLMLLPFVLGSSKLNSRAPDCQVVVVDDPVSVFGHSRVHSPPVGEHLTDNITECIETCCYGDTSCNFGLFLELADKYDTNCILYSCYPLDTCNPQIKKGTLVFVDRFSLEEDYFSPEPKTPSLDKIYSDIYDGEGDEKINAGENQTFVNHEDVIEDNKTFINSTLSNLQMEEETIYQIVSYDVLSSSSTLELTSLLSALGVATTNVTSNNEESLNKFEYLPITTELMRNSVSSDVSASSGITISTSEMMETSAYLYLKPLSTMIFEEARGSSLAVVNFVDISTTLVDNHFLEESTLVQINTSQGILDETSSAILPSTVVFTNSPVVIETEFRLFEFSNITSTLLESSDNSSTLLKSSDNSSTLLEYSDNSSTLLQSRDIVSILFESSDNTPILSESSDISATMLKSYNTVLGQDNSDLSTISEPLQPTATFLATSTQEVLHSSDLDSHLDPNSTELRNMDLQAVKPATTILICILTVGCVFALAVIGVLSVRVYDCYKKRHYSRLDYLMNGMYG